MSDGSSVPPQTPAQAQQQADHYVFDLLTKLVRLKQRTTTRLRYKTSGK